MVNIELPGGGAEVWGEMEVDESSSSFSFYTKAFSVRVLTGLLN